MSAKAKLEAVLTLDNSKFARSIKAATEMAKGMARQFARNPIKTTMVAGLIATEKGFRLAARAATSFGTLLTVGAVGSGMALFTRRAINAAAEMQTMRLQFETLLGSATAAGNRMKELQGFARSTPFDLPEVAEASRVLEVLTEGALSGEKAMRMIGDAAAGANKPFNEVAQVIGRLYTNLSSGSRIGDEMERLREMGLVKGPVGRRISQLSDVGTPKSSAEAWRLATHELKKYAGSTEKLAQSWKGRMSQFKESITDAMRAFGEPLRVGLTPVLKLFTETVDGSGPKMKEMGEALSKHIQESTKHLADFFKDPEGITKDFAHAIDLGLERGVMNLGTYIGKALRSGGGLEDWFIGLLKAGPAGTTSNFARNVIDGAMGKAPTQPPPTGPKLPAPPALPASVKPSIATSPAVTAAAAVATRATLQPLAKFLESSKSRLSTGGLRTGRFAWTGSGGMAIDPKTGESSGLGGSSLDMGAYRKTSLLRAGDRRKMMQGLRAQSQAIDPRAMREGSTGAAYNRISAGDRQRAKAVAKETEKKGQEALNNKTFEAFTTEFKALAADVRAVLK